MCVILASGDVASKVVIEKRTESVMAFYKGSADFYLGYITLKVLYSYGISVKHTLSIGLLW